MDDVLDQGCDGAGARRAWACFELNSLIADMAWLRMLIEHPGEWLAVYGDCEVIVAPSRMDVASRIPAEHHEGAVIRYLADRPAPALCLEPTLVEDPPVAAG